MVAAFAAAGTVGLTAMAGIVRRHPSNRIDIDLYNRLTSDNGQLLGLANAVLEVAGSALALGGVAIAAAGGSWIRWRSARTVAYPLASVAFTGVLADHVLKPLVGRRIPGGALSWPSGTTAVVVAAALAGGLLIVARDGRVRPLVVALAAAAPLSVGTCLLLTGYHFTTDIVGGAMLGSMVPLGLALLHDWTRLDAS